MTIAPRRLSGPFCYALLLASCAPSAKHAGKQSAAWLAPPPATAVDYAISGAAGPDELARQAIAHHPSITAGRHRAERLAAKVPQEKALPDPMAEVAAGSMAETAAGRMDAMGSVKQKIPFPGKRREAAAAAGSEAAAAAAEVRTLELKLTEQVHAAWWDLYLADQTISLTRESRSLLDAVRDAVDAKVSANQATQADQLRISNELSLIDRDLVEARQLRQTARARLNSLLNRPAGAHLPDVRSVPVPSAGSLASLLRRAQARHPEIAAAEERANAFRHRLKRAELEKYPDLTAGVTGASISSSGLAPMANGRDQVYATLGINIPLWQEPRKAMIKEAREGIAETESMLAATRADLRYRVEDAWFRAQSARDITTLFESRLVPDARQTYDVTVSGYSSGNNGFTDLVDTWRGLLAYRLQLARSRAQLGKAMATLRAAAALD